MKKEDPREELISSLKTRFEQNMSRHQGLAWDKIQEKLEADKNKMLSISKMEESGGEPDVVGFDQKTGEYIFYDCSAESPGGRRNTCYDHEGQQAREKKGIYPEGNAVDMATSMGIELLTEGQ